MGNKRTREVQISNAELGAVHMNGQVHFASSAQVLDAVDGLDITPCHNE